MSALSVKDTDDSANVKIIQIDEDSELKFNIKEKVLPKFWLLLKSHRLSTYVCPNHVAPAPLNLPMRAQVFAKVTQKTSLVIDADKRLRVLSSTPRFYRQMATKQLQTTLRVNDNVRYTVFMWILQFSVLCEALVALLLIFKWSMYTLPCKMGDYSMPTIRCQLF